MPVNDVSNMKVADLKRELKLRGLPVTGNKTELQERLQAVLENEPSLEDPMIAGEDLLDEDAVLSDEDEAKILGADENELLKSPTTTPVAIDSQVMVSNTSTTTTPEDDILESSNTSAKKVVLKRKNSFTANNILSAVSANSATTKENTEPSPTKVLKMSERNPITVGNETKKETQACVAANKISQLTMQERLELRAKKFGLNSATTTTVGPATRNGNQNRLSGTVDDDKQIEMLKKRAERFGCVVSPKIAKLDAEEKLLKRKQRFGGSDGDGSNAAKGATPDVWAEKARLRLERFKTAPSLTPDAVTIAAKTADN